MRWILVDMRKNRKSDDAAVKSDPNFEIDSDKCDGNLVKGVSTSSYSLYVQLFQGL